MVIVNSNEVSREYGSLENNNTTTVIGRCNGNEVYRAIVQITKGNEIKAPFSFNTGTKVTNWGVGYTQSTPLIIKDNDEYIAVKVSVPSKTKVYNYVSEPIDVTNFNRLYIKCKEHRDGVYSYPIVDAFNCNNFWSMNITQNGKVLYDGSAPYRECVAAHFIKNFPDGNTTAVYGVPRAGTTNRTYMDENNFFYTEMDISKLSGKVILNIEGQTNTDNRNHVLEIYEIYLEM